MPLDIDEILMKFDMQLHYIGGEKDIDHSFVNSLSKISYDIAEIVYTPEDFKNLEPVKTFGTKSSLSLGNDKIFIKIKYGRRPEKSLLEGVITEYIHELFQDYEDEISVPEVHGLYIDHNLLGIVMEKINGTTFFSGIQNRKLRRRIFELLGIGSIIMNKNKIRHGDLINWKKIRGEHILTDKNNLSIVDWERGRKLITSKYCNEINKIKDCLILYFGNSIVTKELLDAFEDGAKHATETLINRNKEVFHLSID
jgi:predicted Ser/Thr protein kinase